MSKILVKTEPTSAALRKATSALKAAIVVSAAAILSRAQTDLEANAANATGHFDDFARQLRAARSDMLPVAILSASYAGENDTELDADLLDTTINAVNDGLIHVRQALLDVVASDERDGLDVFVDRIGDLGRAFHKVTALVTGPQKDTEPFLFDQFFLESMQDLSQRDWSSSASGET